MRLFIVLAGGLEKSEEKVTRGGESDLLVIWLPRQVGEGTAHYKAIEKTAPWWRAAAHVFPAPTRLVQEERPEDIAVATSPAPLTTGH